VDVDIDALTDAQLASLETHQASLLKADVKAVRARAEGRPSAFDPKADLEPLLASGLTLSDNLPVNVFARWLAERTISRCLFPDDPDTAEQWVEALRAYVEISTGHPQ
jgi:hypothetical protein